MTDATPRIQLVHFSVWGGALETVPAFFQRLRRTPIRDSLPPKADPALEAMASLDRDWHAETSRCLDEVARAGFSPLPSLVTGPTGLPQLLQRTVDPACTPWLIFEGHSPGKLTGFLDRVLRPLVQRGWHIAWYAFDEASRRLPAFREIAPHLSLLIHDEAPLEPPAAALLPGACRTVHRSWVANLVPYEAPWVEAPEPKILFLGSKLGLTPHRQRQIEHLQRHFGDAFQAIHDHSVSVSDRLSLGRFKVSVCPEGRMFSTPAMSTTHTDRPFWSGCLGMVPVCEDSAQGQRLEELHRNGLILRYGHGRLDELTRQCERALALGNVERRRIYDHFNQHETIGTVLAREIGQCCRVRRAA